VKNGSQLGRIFIYGEYQPSVGLFRRLATKLVLIGLSSKNPIEILCHAGALMRFWTGLYAEVEREMLINGVNTMLREAARLLLPKNTAGDRVKRVKSGDNDEDRSL
jgi:hypothetical protein